MSGKTATGKPRQNPGVLGPNPHLKNMRRREAEGIRGVDGCDEDGRNVKWRRLSYQEQLDSLFSRFPDGAMRQKARIRSKIEAEKNRSAVVDALPKSSKESSETKKLSSREKKFEEQKKAREDAAKS